MTQIRITMSTLRSVLHKSHIMSEADDATKRFFAQRREKYDEKPRSDDNVAKHSASGFSTSRVYEPSAEFDDLEPPAPLTPEQFKDPAAIQAHEDALKAYRATRKAALEKRKGLPPAPVPAASIKTGGRPFKQPPGSRPVTKDYVGPTRTAPYLTSKDLQSKSAKGAGQGKLEVPETVVTDEQLKKLSAKAHQNKPEGDWKEIVMRGGYLILKPKNPAQKPLIWASVPPKGNQGPKPHAWRTAEELVHAQRLSLGYLDKTERGWSKSDVAMPHDLDPERGSRVKFKGDPMGRVDIETTGTLHGSSTGPGGTPTKDSSVAVASADKAAKAEIPDWNTLSLATLKKAADMAEKRFKSGKSPEETQILRDISDALITRESGEAPAKPIRVSLPRRLQRNDVRDAIRAFEAKDYERASAFLGSLSPEIKAEVKKLLAPLLAKNLANLDSEE